MKKIFFSLIIILFFSCNNQEEVIKRTSFVMGSTIEVQIKTKDLQKANLVIDSVFNEAKRIDTLFSTYISNNSMWKINNAIKDTIKVDEEIFFILKKSDELWKKTEGAFDPALGNLIQLIGFDKKNPKIPPQLEVKKVLNNIGWKKIKLIEPNILIKPKNVKLNFNAIVPGYAADICSKIIIRNGFNNFLVNVGGEIFCKGDNWKIGIQHPRSKNEILMKINVNNYGISTSGDYEQFIIKGKKRFNHIFNPKTGLPANECESVTIIAKDALTSDVFSTAVFVLGPSKGINLINKEKDIEGIIVDTTGNIIKSIGFKNFELR